VEENPDLWSIGIGNLSGLPIELATLGRYRAHMGGKGIWNLWAIIADCFSIYFLVRNFV
jgi:hypothetical protein